MRRARRRRISTLAAALDAYVERRWTRCKLVVENPLGIGELEVAHSPPEDQQRLVAESVIALAAP